MSVRPLPAAEAVLRLGDFDAVIDARSEGEFAEDHLPGALNWPSLDDAPCSLGRQIRAAVG